MESITTNQDSLDFYFKGPISSLAFQSHPSLRLLSGEGPILTVYDIATKQLVKEIKLFPQCFKILDITISEEAGDNKQVIVVQTEKQLKVLNPHDYEVIYDFSKLSNDKIVRSMLLKHNELLTINAHNYIEVWNLDEMSLMKRHFCEEECILYSGDYNKQTMHIAGGTVFRSIIVWNLNNDLNAEGQSTVQYKLEGHAGVIFDVKFLSSTEVASVSDDRSLRIWKIDLEKKGTYQQLYEFYGHRSRIWKFSELGYQDLLITVSEDPSCKIWERSKNTDSGESNQIINRSIETIKGHSGRNIRALACHEGLIATGGDDGAVKVYQAQQILNQKKRNEEQCSTIVHQVRIPPPLTEEEQKAGSISKEGTNQIRCIEVLSLDPINDEQPLCLVGTNKGSIYAVTLQNQGEQDKDIIFQDNGFGNIQDMNVTKTILRINNKPLHFVVASIGDGEILLFKIQATEVQENGKNYKSELIHRFKVSDIKTLNLFILNERQESEDVVSFDVVASNGRAELINTCLKYHNDGKLEVFEKKVFKVQQKTQFICCILIQERNILLSGDTKGSIFLFDYSSKENPIINYSYLKAHKNERVLSLYYCEESQQVYSTSKDNYINVYNIPAASNEIQKITSIKDEDLNIIYQISKYHSKMILFGFYGNFAYVWNKQENLQIFSVDTKGGNRPMRLRLKGQYHNRKDDKSALVSEQQYGKSFILAYSFGDCLTICNNWNINDQDTNECQFTLKDSLHGREILTSCGFGVSENKIILLTGSEDSFLKVNEYSDNSDIRSINTFSNHIASIRTITKLKVNDNDESKEYLVLSAGSRMQANVFKATFKKKSDNHDFTMAHVCQFMRNSEQDEEQDFRIMSSALFDGDNEYYCAFGTSSGEVQCFWINFNKRRLEDLSRFQLPSSVLSMKRLRLESNKHILICGLSNGDIYLLLVTEKDSKAFVSPHAELKQVHDFGVNSVDAKVFNGFLYVASGGDDQQISILVLQSNEQGQFEVLRKFKGYGHSSSIKGIALFNENGLLQVASSAYDQRFKEWTVDDQEEVMSLKQVRVSRHCMSDINNLSKVRKTNGKHSFILVGQGLAIY